MDPPFCDPENDENVAKNHVIWKNKWVARYKARVLFQIKELV